MSADFDVIVVGAGIFGVCTAYHCRKLGLKTLLLEQFEIGHKNGSSHGKSRIIRYAHEDDAYIPIVSDSYEQIFKLEQERNEKLWKKTSLLWVSTGNEIDKVTRNLKSRNISHEVLIGEEIAKRYEQFKFSEEWKGLVDPMGGVIYADKWHNAFLDEYKKIGGCIKVLTEMKSYKENENGTFSVFTENGNFTSSKLIFTLGSWIQKILPELKFGIEPMSISVCYWKAKEEKNNYLLDEEHYPVVIAQEMGLNRFHFSLPDTDYPGMIKLSYHAGDELTSDFGHPEQNSKEFINCPAAFIEKHLPIIEPKPSIVDLCKYTNSPDDHYIIGPIPSMNPNILVGGCGSGSGFKMAPGIGRALAEMAAGTKPTNDVSFFSASRFLQSQQL